MYMVIGWLLAMIGQPLMRFFPKYVRIGKKWQASKSVAASLTLLTYFIVLGVLFVAFVQLVLNVPLSQANNWLKENGMVADSLSNQDLLGKVVGVEKLDTQEAGQNIFGAFTSIVSFAGNFPLFTSFLFFESIVD